MDYHLFAQAFLDDDQSDAAVCDTFDILWLSWDDALASQDTCRYGWNVLRATVMARTATAGPSWAWPPSTPSSCSP
ncbi:hypothetical protein ABZ568_26150 [Streptomyces olindensis]|uniref:Uncharacterized protein n=1 Tax=Streptomyces olindensis TaxID=358823 RepID=A0ABV2Y0Q4_9ACTN